MISLHNSAGAFGNMTMFLYFVIVSSCFSSVLCERVPFYNSGENGDLNDYRPPEDQPGYVDEQSKHLTFKSYNNSYLVEENLPPVTDEVKNTTEYSKMRQILSKNYVKYVAKRQADLDVESAENTQTLDNCFHANVSEEHEVQSVKNATDRVANSEENKIDVDEQDTKPVSENSLENVMRELL